MDLYEHAGLDSWEDFEESDSDIGVRAGDVRSVDEKDVSRI